MFTHPARGSMVTIERPIITAAASVRAVDSKHASCTMPHVCYIMQIVFESKEIRPVPHYCESMNQPNELNRQISYRQAGQRQATLKTRMLSAN